MNVLLLNSYTTPEHKMVMSGRCQIKKIPGMGLWPPIDLAQIAAALKESADKISIIDFMLLNIPQEEAVSRIISFIPSVIILHNSTPTVKSDIAFVGKLKRALPKVKFIFFGLHATSRPEDILSKDIEYVIRGEPEMAVRDLMEAIRSNDLNIENIKGISYWRDGRIFHNSDREYIRDLDCLPFPEWDYLDVRKYVLPYNNKPFLIINISRGCPFHCIFCTSQVYYGNKWRGRSPENIVSEIEGIIAKYGVNNFLFLADTFNFSKDFVSGLCDLIIRRKLNIKWMCNSRVDMLEKKSLKMMREAGCWLISMGIESGSDLILRNAEKGITTRQAKEAIAAVRKAGIKTLCYFVFGLPGENSATINKTMDFIKECDFNYGYFYSATPFPGTEFYNRAKSAGWLVSDDWNRYSHGSSDVISYPDLPSEAVRLAVARAYRNFYLRPKIFWRELLSVRSPGQFAGFCKIVIDLLEYSFYRRKN